MATSSSFRRNISQPGATFTIATLAIAVINFFATWVTVGGTWNVYLEFDPRLAPVYPWTFLTFPIAANPADIIGILFIGYWMYQVCTEVERELSTPKYAAFFLCMALIPSLMLFLGYEIFHQVRSLYGLYLPVAGVTVAWATRRPTNTILLLMIIPIQAKWLAWLTAIIVVFGYGLGAPVLGLFAAVHLLVAYLFAANKLPIAWTAGRHRAPKQQWLPREKDDKYLEDVKRREMDRAEREKLRKLFEGSVKDDPEDKP